MPVLDPGVLIDERHEIQHMLGRGGIVWLLDAGCHDGVPLKPANVILDADLAHVRLADFGIARFGDTTRITAAGLCIGTAAYLAPEQLEGQVGPAADVYALGLVVLECLTGTVLASTAELDIDVLSTRAPSDGRAGRRRLLPAFGSGALTSAATLTALVSCLGLTLR
jgi:hypothetical protein